MTIVYTNFFGGAFFGGGFFGPGHSTGDTHDGESARRHSESERKRVDEFRRSKEKLRADVESAWKEITEEAPPAAIQEAMQIVKPAMQKSARKMVGGKPIGKPNFDLLSQFRLRQFMQLHSDLQDEEEILLFMDDA